MNGKLKADQKGKKNGFLYITVEYCFLILEIQITLSRKKRQKKSFVQETKAIHCLVLGVKLQYNG